MRDTYDVLQDDAVAQYKAERARIERTQDRNRIVVMAPFALLWSAAGPRSGLAFLFRWAPVFCVLTLVLFAGAVATGTL